ncbi:MAG: hypothetical protein WD063_15420 [Pirellulales bacterium]
MFRRVSLWVAVGILLAAGFNASQASAQVLGPGAYGLGFFNYGDTNYGGNYRIPYYALFPPVYYSYPVARPYGYSPFAYPPGTVTPEATQKVAPVEYRNPFVPQRASSTGDKSASLPRMYDNPFVKRAQTASTLASARQGER